MTLNHLYIQLFSVVSTVIKVSMLLVAHDHQSYSLTSAFRIVPTRLQIFEYASVSFTCEGFNVLAGWRVRNTKEFLKTCLNDIMKMTVTCTIDYAYKSDSGEYWCEGGGGESSNTVHITVTAGSVILESPVLPVMEGEDVTLRCRTKTTSSNFTADFGKDGRFLESSSTGEMIIHNVSYSDEGLYKCSISGAGESPESWLSVRALHRETCPSSDRPSLYVVLVLRTVFTILLVALLLLLVGLLHCGKLRVTHK
ncbi:low affinity immunoglobulin gamma Fc region receptor II-a-like isoform X2 [Acanthopagrus latus]|uniref:low affinity immunoglobulin gamma Fc region receptor II-a-like isoform X2 n=1 Tax=Acanthopagrus latus TaxID=8177 RepID=UPI00187C6C21|nr:low affinity immunoglobulin gamma Fc region receptor II-a-like isoform X2 [Acanthopagrus latus]